MEKAQNEKMPINYFGGHIFFWQNGNTKMASTNLDEKFNITDKNSVCERKLTYFKFGATEQYYNKSLVHYSKIYGDAFSIMPDGTTYDDFLGDKLREPYKDAKFIPLSEQEMQYVKSKMLIPAKAENIIEWRSFFMNQRVISNLDAYYHDPKTKKIFSYDFSCFSCEFLPEENAYLINLSSKSPDIILSNKTYPVTREEILPLIEKYNKIDAQTIREVKKLGIEIPSLISEYCAKKLEESLQDEQGSNI